ncbi:tetratricopeptide repeat protein [Solihabitans fulvus]|uniref:Tetratricopeptide repeat protein n=1 Tax=Solihabitans fulvus TaxID=1892852 RepID=A0A5B2XP64_9PSEU|nr:BTAD domain-containing putative transcriptional regulator [Solihabitans fulvus]KAA2264691.1 tetratricopeptide repeat protein [Solihabitans fulvus]
MRTEFRYRLLGPLTVLRNGSPVPITAAKQRALLAALLVDPNRNVPVDTLIARVWGPETPQGNRNTLQKHVVRLRRTLAGEGHDDPITTQPDGYSLAVADSALDITEFDTLAHQARSSLADGDAGSASGLLGRALSLWHGEPLADVPSDVLHREFVPPLAEKRLAAIEHRIEADLQLGRHAHLGTELRELTARHPLRERFWAQRMLALYRSGRQAEAVDSYRAVSGILADELGIDPGAQLRELHQRILSGDAALDAPDVTPAVPHRVTPRQLPAHTAHFVGRAKELHRLTGLLDSAAHGGGTVVISAVDGSAGIGKTTLAVHWARQTAERFPDGQLFVNLRGFDPSRPPTRPEDAVRGLLNAFEVPPERIPPDPDAQAALYRSLVADRHMVIVLDNARDADQVRPLLPGSPNCVVVITSRNQLAGLVAHEGARPLTLDVLSREEAVALLARYLGEDRVTAEPEAVSAVIEHCARLPLALAIAAARAALNPQLPLRTLAEDLRDARTRLNILDAGDRETNVRAVFSWSYAHLSSQAARMFRFLGEHPGPDISLPAAASLAGMPTARTGPLLAELTRAHMLTEHVPGRFTFHDLLRVYATERARSVDSEDERHAAIARTLDHYLQTGHAANVVMHPTRLPITLPPPHSHALTERISDSAQALAWFDAELPVLTASIDKALECGFNMHAWQIPWTLASYLDWQGHPNSWVSTQRIALLAAQRLQDREAQARTHLILGHACAALRLLDEARLSLQSALELARQLGDVAGEASAHRALGWACDLQNDPAGAVAHCKQALALFKSIGRTEDVGSTLNAISVSHANLGDQQSALSYAARAIEACRAAGLRRDEGDAMNSLAYIHYHFGDHPQALASLIRASELYDEQRDRYKRADVLANIGDVHHATGDPEAAQEAWSAALIILDELGHPAAQKVRAKLD